MWTVVKRLLRLDTVRTAARRAHALRIVDWDIPVDAALHPGERSGALVLGQVIRKAMESWMLSLEMCLDPGSGSCSLKFRGPLHYPEEQRSVYDMYPSPGILYTSIVGVLLTWMHVDSKTLAPLEGTVLADWDGRRFPLSVWLHSLYELNITWPEDVLHWAGKVRKEEDRDGRGRRPTIGG